MSKDLPSIVWAADCDDYFGKLFANLCNQLATETSNLYSLILPSVLTSGSIIIGPKVKIRPSDDTGISSMSCNYSDSTISMAQAGNDILMIVRKVASYNKIFYFSRQSRPDDICVLRKGYMLNALGSTECVIHLTRVSAAMAAIRKNVADL